MRPYGAKRTYKRCWTSRRRRTTKVHVRVRVKNHKRERALPVVIEE